MEVETLGLARGLGWKVHMRCADGYREGTRSMRRCVYRKQLDLETLVWTRGPNFPLSRLESRLMCPSCRRVTVMFEPPTNREVRSGLGRASDGNGDLLRLRSRGLRTEATLSRAIQKRRVAQSKRSAWPVLWRRTMGIAEPSRSRGPATRLSAISRMR